MNRDAFNIMLDSIDRATGTAGSLYRVQQELQRVYVRGVRADREQAAELLERAETLTKLLAADLVQARLSFERTYEDEPQKEGGRA